MLTYKVNLHYGWQSDSSLVEIVHNYTQSHISILDFIGIFMLEYSTYKWFTKLFYNISHDANVWNSLTYHLIIQTCLDYMHNTA